MVSIQILLWAAIYIYIYFPVDSRNLEILGDSRLPCLKRSIANETSLSIPCGVSHESRETSRKKGSRLQKYVAQQRNSLSLDFDPRAGWLKALNTAFQFIVGRSLAQKNPKAAAVDHFSLHRLPRPTLSSAFQRGEQGWRLILTQRQRDIVLRNMHFAANSVTNCRNENIYGIKHIISDKIAR